VSQSMRISRRRFLALSAAAVALGACRSGGGGAEFSGRLRVLNWSDYIDPETVERFEQATSVPVDYVEGYEGNEEAFESVFEPTLGRGRPTGFDVIVPTYWAVARLLERGWLQRIPLERVPNHVNIEPAYLGMPWDRGARFHMPWQVGITGIAYNPALTGGREIRQVSQLFEPSLRGRVAMVSEMRETVGMVMLTQGADPARATRAAADQALERLARAKADGQIRAFTADFVDLLEAGEVAACLAWSGDIIQLQQDRPDIRFVIPEEGAIRWFDSMVVPARSAGAAAAADWMNFAYDPVNAARITEAVQYISPVLGVREELQRLGGASAELAQNPILFPDEETRRRLYFWAGLDTAAEDELQQRFSTIAG
jgi:spermidine/putrescine transport system substrate-binding protein